MSFETAYFDTDEYGVVGLTTSPIDENGEDDVGTLEQLSSYDFSDNADKTWGLATKFYVLSAIHGHDDDLNAHQPLFNDILSRYSDALISGGEFKFSAIRDLSGNVIYANGKSVYDDGRKSGYIVTSNAKENTSFDELTSGIEEEFDGIRETLESKQTAFTAGKNISLDPETRVMSAKDTIYVLPAATMDTLGGVYYGSEIGDYRHVVPASSIAIELAKKENVLTFGSGITSSERFSITLDYADLSNYDASTMEQKPVRGGDAYAALASKQDTLIQGENVTLTRHGQYVRIGTVPYTLHAATTDTLGGVYYSSSSLEATGEYTVPASVVYGAIVALRNAWVGVSGISISDSTERSTELPYFQPFKRQISVDYGSISPENTDRPVRGSDIYRALEGKSGILSFDGDFVHESNGFVSLNFADEITSGTALPVSGGAISRFIVKERQMPMRTMDVDNPDILGPGSYAFRNSNYSITVGDFSDTSYDYGDGFSLTMTIPDQYEGRSRKFSSVVILPRTTTGTTSSVSASFDPNITWYSEDSTSPFLPMETNSSGKSVFLFDFEEIAENSMLITRRTLMQYTATE